MIFRFRFGFISNSPLSERRDTREDLHGEIFRVEERVVSNKVELMKKGAEGERAMIQV